MRALVREDTSTPLHWFNCSRRNNFFIRCMMVLSPNVILDEQRKLKKYIKYDIFQAEAHDVRPTIRA